jgi:ATP-dependent RNA circularization protein (DNA/RNA ligase family)
MEWNRTNFREGKNIEEKADGNWVRIIKADGNRVGIKKADGN